MARIQQETESKLRDYEREFEVKLDQEKKTLAASYDRIRRSTEQQEQERFEFELEKFRKEQNKALEAKRGDIDKLTSEKRKIQTEFSQQLEQLRKDSDRRYERENRELQEQMTREMVELQKEEERKYEQALEAMKKDALKEAGRAGDKLEQEVSEYKAQLDDEAKRVLQEHEI